MGQWVDCKRAVACYFLQEEFLDSLGEVDLKLMGEQFQAETPCPLPKVTHPCADESSSLSAAGQHQGSKIALHDPPEEDNSSRLIEIIYAIYAVLSFTRKSAIDSRDIAAIMRKIAACRRGL